MVSYASCTCSTAESKLGPTDGKLLAIVYAMEKFHHLLAGTTFTVHFPLANQETSSQTLAAG